jgi:hypothetical protein
MSTITETGPPPSASTSTDAGHAVGAAWNAGALARQHRPTWAGAREATLEDGPAAGTQHCEPVTAALPARQRRRELARKMRAVPGPHDADGPGADLRDAADDHAEPGANFGFAFVDPPFSTRDAVQSAPLPT